ncbi:MAG: EamA family transporter [Candidatus Woesearchaeota archaeon]|nr:EamA family transporter [Candidatus Woesearchaeota archaeon]
MKTKLWAIILVLVCTIFTSIGQILYKIASRTLSLNIYSIITNVPLIVGLASYFVGAVLLIIALRNGELSVLYPFVSTGFVWVSILSTRFLGESMSMQKWAGIAVIFFGISLIGIGSNKGSAKKNIKVRKK